MTHIPFLMPVGTPGEPIAWALLLFRPADAVTQPADSRPWRIHCRTPDGIVRRLLTDLPDDLCECSPTAWHDETGWRVTLVAGGGLPENRYCLYRLDGPALDQLDQVFGQPFELAAHLAIRAAAIDMHLDGVGRRGDRRGAEVLLEGVAQDLLGRVIFQHRHPDLAALVFHLVGEASGRSRTAPDRVSCPRPRAAQDLWPLNRSRFSRT